MHNSLRVGVLLGRSGCNFRRKSSDGLGFSAVAIKNRIKMKEEEQERDGEQKNSGKESKKKLIRGSIRGHTTAVTWRQREFPFVNGR